MKFLKMFFAGLLAFVVGSAVMLFLSVMILFGIVGSMTSSEPVTVGEHAILKLDFSEDLIESPSSDPFAGIDFATMTARHQVTLYNALRAIETAKNDPRIQGIYLRPNGGGVATYAILEELREAIAAIDFHVDGQRVPITVSGGCASWPGSLNSIAPEQLIEAADQQLYLAKQQGRNRICGVTLESISA